LLVPPSPVIKKHFPLLGEAKIFCVTIIYIWYCSLASVIAAVSMRPGTIIILSCVSCRKTRSWRLIGRASMIRCTISRYSLLIASRPLSSRSSCPCSKAWNSIGLSVKRRS
jgi:hypothetical protein